MTTGQRGPPEIRPSLDPDRIEWPMLQEATWN
jgi:hypothetical protein